MEKREKEIQSQRKVIKESISNDISSLFSKDFNFFERSSYEDENQLATVPISIENETYYEKTENVDFFPSTTQRRKSSIEMFLSCSPSQHLGNDFFKMNLDESNGFDFEKSSSLHIPRGYHGRNSSYEEDENWYQEKKEETPLYQRARMSNQESWAQPISNNYPQTIPPRRFQSLLSPDRIPPSTSMLKQCKFFAQGHCRMGIKCKFSHHTNNFEDDFHPFGYHGPIPRSESSSPSSHDGFTSFCGSFTEEDLKGRVFAMSKDQNGCRLLQEQLDLVERTDLCDLIFNESLGHLVDMMVDPFGNYLFQKLLERVSNSRRILMIQEVSNHIVSAALNLHGTRSVQKLIEISSISGDFLLRNILINSLKENIVRLCIDSNGNHVIQRTLQYFPSELNQFIFDSICKECTVVGTHRHGCCVLQRCIDNSNLIQKKKIILKVENNAMKLMQDPYGNYVVQYILDACHVSETIGLMEKCIGFLYELSIQKFSSNVVEKCLQLAPDSLRQIFVKEIIACPRMYRMLQDQYANYVVQRALSVASDENCLNLVGAIRPHLNCMKNTQGGRRIQARILKRFPHLDVDWDPEYNDSFVSIGMNYSHVA